MELLLKVNRNDLSNMMQQYYDLKINYPDTIIVYADECVMKPLGEDPLNFSRIYFKECSNYDECDEWMTYNSDFDIAWIRPGRENSHTALNIKRRYGLF